MKSILALSAIFVSVFAAAPLDTAWYNIHTTSDVAQYNNLYIGYKNGRIGAIRGTRESAARAQKFYTKPYPPTGTLSLITGDGHGVALRIMQTGIHALVDLATQSQADIQAGQVEWSTFVIGGDENGGDGKEGDITIKDNQRVLTRRWILFQNSTEFYSINLYDGVSAFSQKYANISLVARKTREPSV